MKRPPTPVMSIDYFGAVKPNLSQVVRKLHDLIRELRTNPSNKEELQKEFRYWWRYRHRFLDYYYGRKLKKRNNGNIEKNPGPEKYNGIPGSETKGDL